MEKIVEVIEKINGPLNSFAWGPIMLVLLVGTGVLLSARTGFVQVRRFGYIMKNTIGSLFKKSDKDHGNNLSPFQAVSTALAGTVGTGNIAGVTGAIFVGGPGAVFWMWVSEFFGMCTKYAEIALAVKFRETGDDGKFHGGPMYYITNGLGKNWKFLAIIFALLGGLASFGIGNIAQTNEIAGAMSSLFGMSPLVTGIVLAVIVAIVVIGGVKRIGQVTSLLVPFMSLIYVVAGIAVIVLRITDIPAALATIITSAFSFEAVGGGIFGYAIMLAIRQGAGAGKGEVVETEQKAKDEEAALRRPRLLLFNLALTIGLIAVLSVGYITSYVAFLLALSMALAVNYPSLKLQDKLIKKHAPAALMVSPLTPATYLAIGLTGTELKDHMKFSIPPYWLVSICMLLIGIVIGIIPVF